uniref:Nipped-B protein n=1 Tax=Romanomermis culicivorax TaxID=13658 RepID=A0A915HGM1_ROMCU
LVPNEDEIDEEKIASPASVGSSADDDGKSSPPPQNAKDDDEWREMLRRRKEKYKRRSSRAAFIDPKEIAENESYSRFLASIDNVFENVEDCDLIGDEEEIPSECLVSKLLLTELNSESSKLRAVGLLHKVPVDRLTKLITILERNIKDGSNIALTCDEKVDDGNVLDLISDRVFRSLDSAILALTIMTGQGMPRQVYIEDAIERAAQLLKFQLINTVAPAFDPTYRTLKDIDNDFNPKSKKFKSGSSSGASKNKLISAVYGRLIELVSSFADLILMQTLPETTIMQHLREFQLNSLRLLANVFNRYENCRKIILEEILISLARSPTSKKSSRIYKLSVDESVQMITALVLLLVQSAVHVPSARQEAEDDDESSCRPKLTGLTSLNPGSFALMTYDRAAGTAHTFLNAFLNKCRTKSEEDYRPLFEAFVEDLLVLLNKLEWPAAEIFLNLLGKLLIQNFSNKQTDVSLRVASLDYLGLIAARLRKDAVNCPVDEVALKNFIDSLPQDENSNYSNLGNNSAFVLQSALIDYLVELKDGDPVIDFAKHYYIAEWYKDATSHQESNSGHQKHKKEKHDHIKCENNAEQLKNAILSLVDRDVEDYYGSKLQHKGSALRESQVGYVIRYLASKRPLAQSFDAYLAHILRILNETTVSIRSKAMKCLAFVVEADPSILARTDVHKGVHSRLIDTSSSVREVVVDLIGKFVTAKPELIDQYYQMISDRILDTGLSVRKRVIKILRDICEKQPDYEKCAEICVRLLRRMNDEESIRKLVCETFSSLWFTPVRERDTVKLLKKVLTITDAVGACAKDGGQYEGFESLLSTLLCKEQDKVILHAAKQIVNCLVENVLTLDERLADNDPDRSCNHQRMLNCLTTLYLFAKIKPTLMVEHAQIMQPYLSMNATLPDEIAVLIQVIKILEMVVPLMDHPSTTFLSQVEDILIKLMLKSGQTVVQASISCLASIVNRLTKNWQKPLMLLQKYLGYFCTNNPEYLIRDETKDVYLSLLNNPVAEVKLKIQVLINIESFLKEEELKMTKSYKQWDQEKSHENLKDMGDVLSGQGSSIIQHYLKDVLESYFHNVDQVRAGVCQIIVLTVQQGLVHPVQCIPSLMAMCTDSNVGIQNKAERALKEVDSKYSGFVQMKAVEGIKLSFKIQKVLVESKPPVKSTSVSLVRGLRVVSQEAPQALNLCIYSLLRSVRQQRRGFLRSLLQSFDDASKCCFEELVYIADNISAFPYQTIDEPLFVIHSIDLTVSVTGASLLQSFEEALLPSKKQRDENDEIETESDIYDRLPSDLSHLEECVESSRGCSLLLILKQYLKDSYGVNDSKIQEYSPSEPVKTYDKPVAKRSSHPFNPKQVVTLILASKKLQGDDARRHLCKQYIDFKEKLMSIDTASAIEANDNAIKNDQPLNIDYE